MEQYKLEHVVKAWRRYTSSEHHPGMFLVFTVVMSCALGMAPTKATKATSTCTGILLKQLNSRRQLVGPGATST